MSYLSRPTLGGRAPRGASGMGEVPGDIDRLAQRAAQLLAPAFAAKLRSAPCEAHGVLAGDAFTPKSASVAIESRLLRSLQQQLNRYVVGTPVKFPQTFAGPIAITGSLDQETAHRAVMVMQLRAGAAHIAWNDGATAELLREVMVSGYANPIAYVDKHFDRVSQIVRLFADKNGLAPAKSDIGITPSVIAGVITLGAIAIIFKGKK